MDDSATQTRVSAQDGVRRVRGRGAANALGQNNVAFCLRPQLTTRRRPYFWATLDKAPSITRPCCGTAVALLRHNAALFHRATVLHQTALAQTGCWGGEGLGIVRPPHYHFFFYFFLPRL